jgi:hypothetical protein
LNTFLLTWARSTQVAREHFSLSEIEPKHFENTGSGKGGEKWAGQNETRRKNVARDHIESIAAMGLGSLLDEKPS